MKKQLKEELITLAEKILQSGQDDQLSISELKKLSLQLYEKLTVLQFAESAIMEPAPVEERKAEKASEVTAPAKQETPAPVEARSSAQVPSEHVSSSFDFPDDNEHGDDHDEYAPDGTQYNTEEGLMEPNTEKIKDIVAQMPPEAQEVDDMLEYILPRKFMKNDMEDIGGVHYDHLPQFEPVHSRPSEPEKPKSLNDRLKKGIQIGINDRIAFVRHLFDGSTSDYNRVLSQLNTLKSREEAVSFVLHMVKPDYNNWEGKDEYEHRFLNIVENRFD